MNETYQLPIGAKIYLDESSWRLVEALDPPVWGVPYKDGYRTFKKLEKDTREFQEKGTIAWKGKNSDEWIKEIRN
jgi:hypothetical protein